MDRQVLLQLVSAAVFVQLEEEWDYGDAIYHCIVTATTVGYGDVSIATQRGELRGGGASGNVWLVTCGL